MSERSQIEWTDATWNPVTGCTKVSPGCTNCYAERMAGRLAAMGGAKYANGFAPTFHRDALDEPSRWRRPRRVFVCSMGDLFNEQIGDAQIIDVFSVMDALPQHTFQVLTKRAERMADFVRYVLPGVGLPGVGMYRLQPNIWLGVTAEDQERANERLPYLLRIPATVRFVSCEPLLGPIDLTRATGCLGFDGAPDIGMPLHGADCCLQWVIAGGESGPGARACPVEWVRSLRNQTKAAHLPFFFKGHGSHSGNDMPRGNLLDGRAWQEFPEQAPIGSTGR